MVGERSRKECGTVFVEAAIALPVFLFLVIASLQVGFAYSALTSMRHASAMAARSAILGSGQTTTQVCDVARSSLVANLDPQSLTCVTYPSTLPTTTNIPITVTVSYPVPVLFPGAGISEGPTWTLTASTTMQ